MTKWLAVLISLLLFSLAAGQSLYTSSAERSVRYAVAQVNASGVAGSVLIADYGRRTVVSVALAGTRPGERHPTHFHLGRCGTGGDIVVLLQSVRGDSGFSVTVLDVPFDDLIGGEYYLNVHRSPAELDTILACGEVGLHATPLELRGVVEPVEAEPLEPAVEDEAVEVEEAEPVAPRTLELRIVSQADDAEEFLDEENTVPSDDYNQYSTYTLGSRLRLGYNAQWSTSTLVGLRFQDLAIPQGATITQAYIEFTARDTDSDEASLTLYGEKRAAAPSFVDQSEAMDTPGNRDLSERVRTSSSVMWSPEAWRSGERYRTPDLAPIVQEIVNQEGWTLGNALVILVEGEGSRSAVSYDHDPSAAPRLVVEYE